MKKILKFLNEYKKWVFFTITLLCIDFVVEFIKVKDSLKDKLKTLISVIIIITITLILESLTEKIIKNQLKSREIVIPSLIWYIIKAIFLTLGTLIALERMGISLTPIITTLGIGSLAVALALQDPLKDLFSGINLTITKKIKPGDYIRLENGIEGIVEDISWNSTMIRQPSNNMIIIPNSTLTKSIITNYNLPSLDTLINIEVGVSYDSDLDKVEKITLEVAKEILKKFVGETEDFKPIVRYRSFGEYSINLIAILKAKSYQDQFIIRHEFMKELYKRFKKEGIEIPFPTKTVYIKNSTGTKDKEG